jgi:hypothetical protein
MTETLQSKHIYLYTVCYTLYKWMRRSLQQKNETLTSRRISLAAGGGWNTIPPAAAHRPFTVECGHVSTETLR